MFERLKRLRFYEEDSGDNPVATVAETPVAVVHTAETVPGTTVHVAKDAAEIPHAAIHTTLSGLTTATEALTSAANRLADLAEKSTATTQEVATEPIQGGQETAEEIAPEIVAPPPERRIRRNGRKVRR
jgi:hypothetical protein